MKQCNNITSAGLERFTAGAPQLRSLNINGCTTVGRVLLTAHPHLEALDMAGCRAVATLRSNSRKLRQLTAAGCRSLKTVELAADGLDSLNLTNTALTPESASNLMLLLEGKHAAGR
mmetsp:Transcript_41209/g.106708  ORF Transcript_41209/g.106708 Transcript_41209/m.106708 type:complete len:117 (+) Transcript_41209:1078-1428(+)